MIRRTRTAWTASICLLGCAGLALAENGYRIEPDVVYGHKLGMALTLDVFYPEAANGAAVLYMVSGGWFSRWVRPEAAVQRFEPYLEAGFIVLAVRHGSAPLFKVPDAVDDVRRAVRYVRHNAEELGIDANRIGVLGGSAGGHLSLMLGTAADDGKASASDPVEAASSRVAAVVAYYPPVDLRRLTGPSERFPALDFAADAAPDVSPLLHVSPDDAPTLLVHGDEDRLVPISHSERIRTAFVEHGVPHELIVLEGAGHGFRGAHREQAHEATLRWFVRHLAKPVAAVAATSQ